MTRKLFMLISLILVISGCGSKYSPGTGTSKLGKPPLDTPPESPTWEMKGK